MNDKNNIRVGIGVMIFKNGKVLLSKRQNTFGDGEYQFPGGHLEYLESFKECARREVREEAGIEIKNIRLQFAANIKKYKNSHYVHLGIICDWKSGAPKTLEPHKSTDWEWYELNNLPSPMFEATRLAFESLKSGRILYDS